MREKATQSGDVAKWVFLVWSRGTAGCPMYTQTHTRTDKPGGTERYTSDVLAAASNVRTWQHESADEDGTLAGRRRTPGLARSPRRQPGADCRRRRSIDPPSHRLTISVARTQLAAFTPRHVETRRFPIRWIQFQIVRLCQGLGVIPRGVMTCRV